MSRDVRSLRRPKTFKLERVDPSERWVQSVVAEIHLSCFRDMDVVEFLGDWWLVNEAVHGRTVGFACLWPLEHRPESGYLARAGILPCARGHGLQRRLIRVRETEARRKGWTRMVSDTWPGNPHSLNNLFACGYRAYTPDVKWAGGDWIYVEKELG